MLAFSKWGLPGDTCRGNTCRKKGCDKMVGVLDRHGKTDGPPPQRMVDVGLGHPLVALWSVNSPLQLLFPVVAPFGTEVIQARLCTNSDRSGIAEVALFDHLQDVGAVKRWLLADGLAIQAIRGGRDFQDEGPFEGLQDSLILRCTAPMSFIYHDQAIVHSWEQSQVIGAANGINTSHRHLPSIVVDAPSYLPDDGRRFDLAVFLGRLREQFVSMSNNERVDSVAIRKLSNDLAEDDGFACGCGENQQFLPMSVVFVGHQDALHTLLLIWSEHNGRERRRRSIGQGGTDGLLHWDTSPMKATPQAM